MIFDKSTCLIIVDPQLDFMPGGALAVPDGDTIVPYINKLREQVYNRGGHVTITADWHPTNHSSFKEQGGLWPRHCVQFSQGASFHPDLQQGGYIFQKGFEVGSDSYSGFGGLRFLGNESQSLGDYLKLKNTKKVVVVGLALEYCVLATALDAKKAGYEVLVDLAGIKAVDPSEETKKKIMEELLSNYIMVLE